jgi:hypothetical protein
MDDFFQQFRADRLPTSEDMVSDWTIFRAKPGRDTKMVIWSDDLFGCRTHWWTGRTIPCKRSGCEACTAGKVSRFNGWVFAKLVATEEKVIFEFTPPAALFLDSVFEEFGSLRGAQIIATRKGDRANAMVHVRCVGREKNWKNIPNPPDIVPVMCRIWGVSSAPDIIVGGTDSQPLSEAERVQMNGTKKRGVRYNAIPQSSLLQAPPAAPVELERDAVLQMIAKEAFVDGQAINRVNGRAKKARN